MEARQQSLDKLRLASHPQQQQQQQQEPVEEESKEGVMMDTSPDNNIATNNNNKSFASSSVRSSTSSWFASSQIGYQDINVQKAVNQDRFVGIPQFTGNSALFGVFDGHGGTGEIVSQFVADHLPAEINNALKDSQILALKDDGESFMMEAAMKLAFFNTSEKLIDQEAANCAFSGTTAVVVMMSETTMYCANLGDSRAILGSFTEEDELIVTPLSDDHKPEREDESHRILARNGRIDACRDTSGEPVGPLRVWLKRQNVPGLAMTRSFGDLVAASVGVIAEPEVRRFEVTPLDKYLIIASDGVWEFISNEEAVELVAGCLTPEEACQLLTEESTKRWKREEDVVDDITVIVAFL